MKKNTRTVLVTAFTTLFFISCASKPAVQDVPEESTTPSAERSVTAESSASDDTADAAVPEEEIPSTEIRTIEPDEPDPDYIYPEPVLMMVPDEIEPEEEIPPVVATPDADNKTASPEPVFKPQGTETTKEPVEPPAETVLADEPSVSSVQNVSSAETDREEPVEPSTETEPVIPVPPAPAGSAETTVPEISPDEKDSQEPDAAIVPDEKIPEPKAGIWTDENRVSEAPPPVEQPVVVPSRSVTVPKDGILEVWYPGTGWVYLGDASGLIGVAYETRKIEDRNTLFSFRARKTGSYILEFSRYDVLTDEFIEDALSVTVTEPESGKKTTVRAPDFSLGKEFETPETPEAPGEQEYSSPNIQDEPVLSSPLSVEPEPETVQKEQTPDELLEEVQSLLASGDAPGALKLLDRFFAQALNRLDEGWYLRGQAYEANSPVRNIRKALDAYETVVSAYPESNRWKDADERVRYIKQFYFRVR